MELTGWRLRDRFTAQVDKCELPYIFESLYSTVELRAGKHVIEFTNGFQQKESEIAIMAKVVVRIDNTTKFSELIWRKN